MSRLKLTDVEWGNFKIKDLFTITPVKGKPIRNYSKGDTPYITTSSLNNGVSFFVKSNGFLSEKNTISIDPIAGKSFFHDYRFIGRGGAGSAINLLYNKYLNKYNGKFICTAIEKNSKDKASYGIALNGDRLKQQTILIPIEETGEPNWQFMEEYIKQEQKEQAQKIINYYEDKILKTAFDLVGLENVEWKEYRIGSLFSFERKPSKGLNHLNSESNGISYLGATNRNNGVLDFVERKEELIYKGNAIAFIRNGEGSMGYSIYKKEPFIATQDISVGYNENLNQYNAMFITSIADRVRGKYNFGYKRNQQRLEAEVLQLPADSNGNPHWDYMSKFMQNIEAEKLSKALEYIYIYI